MYEKSCDHLIEGTAPDAKSETCEACLEAGQTPVQLRICRTCGHVGCCDSTPGQHASAHYHETGHATMQSFQPGADWGWCYVHEKEIGTFPPAR